MKGDIQAYLIWSDVLGTFIWLVMDKKFTPKVPHACYYPEEIPLLKNKTADQLREIQKQKIAFNGARVTR